jgi:flagellar biosynthetic protein FlhB
MAEESESGQEKTEEPTHKRLTDAREKGQVARSRELATAAVFGFATLAVWGFGETMAQSAGQWLRACLTLEPGSWNDANFLTTRFGVLMSSLLAAVSPILLASLIGAFVGPTALGGIRFSAKAVTPDLTKLDPAKGLKRIYGPDGLAELVKSIFRVLLIAGVSGATIVWIAPQFIGLMHEPLGNAAGHGFQLMLWVMLAICAGLLVLAGADTPYQLWSHRRKLRMTRQELRDEMKETEGRPEIKSKIRRLQQMMAQGRMMEAVPTADVIVVNPTHFAVALVYSGPDMRAPRVVAKGRDLVAQAIRELGEKNGVPIVSSPPLARVLYRSVEIGQEIPVNLYSAVAQILGYVHQLRTWRRHGGPLPEVPTPDVREDPPQ